MKKVSTRAVKQTKKFTCGGLKIVLIWGIGQVGTACWMNPDGAAGTEVEHNSENHEGSVRGNFWELDCGRDGDAFALGWSPAERART